MFERFVNYMEERFGLSCEELNFLAGDIIDEFSTQIAETGCREEAMFNTMDYIMREYSAQEEKYAMFILGFVTCMDSYNTTVINSLEPLIEWVAAATKFVRG